MPSIMDLVREYSELEMKRAERGGMLEPHLEIRYQALKFFLEFELFPAPMPKPVESIKPAEKRRVSEEISRQREPVEKMKEEQIVTQAAAYTENREVQKGVESAENLASIISETTLPVSEDLKPETSPIQSERIEVPEYQSPSGEENEKIEVSSLKIPDQEGSNSVSEEVLEMEEVVDEALKNITDQGNIETSSSQSIGVNEEAIPSTIAVETSRSEVESAISPEQPSPERLMGDIDLSEHIESAFNNVIQLDETEQAKGGVAENILPDIDTIQMESTTQNMVSPQEIGQQDAIQVDINTTNPSLPQSDEGSQTVINIEDILSPAPPSEPPVAETIDHQATNKEETPILNIEEIISQPPASEILKEDLLSPQIEQEKENRAINIDFLNAIDLAAQIPQEYEEKKTSEEPPVISIDEIIPQEISLQQTSEGVREFVSSPAKAAVHMVDGDARRGVIKHLTTSTTEVELFEDERSDRSVKLPISGIKAIFLMRQPQEKPLDVSGIRLNVKFKDERSIVGISPDYSDEATIFTLIPPDNSNPVKMIVVYKHFVEQVEMI